MQLQKIALSTTCAADESKRKTFWPQGHLQVSENKRIHVNGCPRMGVIVFFLLSFFQLKPTVYIFAARLDIILWRGVIIQSQVVLSKCDKFQRAVQPPSCQDCFCNDGSMITVEHQPPKASISKVVNQALSIEA